MNRIPLQVRQVMSSPVVKVTPGTPVVDAADRLLRHGLFAMPVVEDGALVGIVDEPALFRATTMLRDAAAGSPSDEDTATPRVVGDVMRRPVTFVKTTDSVQLAAHVLSRQERVLPVLDHGRVVGMLSRSDLLAVMTAPGGRVPHRVNGLPTARRVAPPPAVQRRPRPVESVVPAVSR